MSLFPLALPPGAHRLGTELQSAKRWWLTNLVRWIGDALAPIGGWQVRNPDADPVIGMARAMFGWVDNSGDRWAAIGTHRKVYVQNEAGDLADITPLRDSNSLGSDPIATTDASATITVTDTGHGASVGEFVTLSGATAVGGLTTDQLNATFEILTTPDANTWTAAVSGDAATSAASGGGSAVEADYQISAGEADGTVYTGFGYGPFGMGTFGTPRPDTGSIVPATVWAFDKWGERLVACAAYDGKLYEWALSTASPLAVISNAPTGCRAVVVTDNRILMALGAGGNPRKVQWCDQENNTAWTPSTTNRAGDFELNTVGRLMCGRAMSGSTLLLTDVDAWRANYLGAPLVYGFERVGQGCGVISQGALVSLDAEAAWMGREKFWIYTGGFVQTLPCEIADYVFGDINTSQVSKVTGQRLTAHSEVWWFYPSAGSNENDRYVVWNYATGKWCMGELVRLCGIDQGVFEFPLMMGADGLLYEHETGYSYDGAIPFAESGPLRLGSGDRMMQVQGLVPDEKTAGDVQVTFYARTFPNSEETTHGPYSLTSPTDFLWQAGQVRIRYEGVALGDWRVGAFSLDVTPGDPLR